MARVTKGPTVEVPRHYQQLLLSLRRVARRVGLTWPTVNLSVHEWIRHGGEDIYGSTDVKRGECWVAMRADDGQPEHTMLHEVVHGIVHPVYRWRRHLDEHPPVYWSVHGMLYKLFIDGR